MQHFCNYAMRYGHWLIVLLSICITLPLVALTTPGQAVHAAGTHSKNATAATITPTGITNAYSNSGPSATYCRGTRYIGFRGTDNHINIESADGSQHYVFSDTTTDTPAINCFQGLLYTAWQTADSAQYILIGYFIISSPSLQCPSQGYCSFTYSNNPLTDPFGNWIHTGFGPTLTSDGQNTMWISWTDPSTARIFIMETNNGYSWHTENGVSDYTSSGAVLAYSPIDNTVYVVWTATDGAGHIVLKQYNETSTLTDLGAINNSICSYHRPGVAITGSGLVSSATTDPTEVMISWVGTNNTDITVASWDPFGWNEQNVLPSDVFNTNVSPAVATDNVNVYYEYTNTSNAIKEVNWRTGHAAIILVHGYGTVDCGLTFDQGGGDSLYSIQKFLYNEQQDGNAGPHTIDGVPFKVNLFSIYQVGFYNPDSTHEAGCDNLLNYNNSSCNTYLPDGMTSSQVGTADDSIYHISCELAQYINSKFNYPDSNVEIVAHSMGGLIVRNMIYQIQQNKAPQHFPSLNSFPSISDVVTISTPHGGIQQGGEIVVCQWADLGICIEGHEMQIGSSFMAEMGYAENPQARGGTDWTLLGSAGDGYVNGQNATAMVANHKEIYTTPAYDHDHILLDTNTALGATTSWCDFGGCAANTWSNGGGRPYPLLRTEYALWFSNH